jgi:hypothetical protein
MLLRTGQAGTAEQQAAFFSFLVTLLKLSAMSAFTEMQGALCNKLRAQFTASAASMAVSCKFTCDAGESGGVAVGKVSGKLISSASKSGGSSSSSMLLAPWLLLLGRCCSQWAAELAQMQADAVHQLISRAQDQQGDTAVAGEAPSDVALMFCFAGSRAQLLNCAQSVLSVLGEGSSSSSSSSSAGLAAAGYDMEPVLKGFEALAACYPTVLGLEVIKKGLVRLLLAMSLG